jgi:hypothetical protein
MSIGTTFEKRLCMKHTYSKHQNALTLYYGNQRKSILSTNSECIFGKWLDFSSTLTKQNVQD